MLQAKSTLSRLVESIEKGRAREIVIAHNAPVVTRSCGCDLHTGPSALQTGFHPGPRCLPQGWLRGGGGGGWHIVGTAPQQHVRRGLVTASGAQGAAGCHGRRLSWHDVLLGDAAGIGRNLKKLKPPQQDDDTPMAWACRNSRHTPPQVRHLNSIHRVVIAHIDRDDLLITDEQLQRDAIRQVDRHRMQATQTA